MCLFMEEGPDPGPQSQEKSCVQGLRREGATDQNTDSLDEEQHSWLAAGLRPGPASVEGKEQLLKARAGKAKGQSASWGKMAQRILLKKRQSSTYDTEFLSDSLPITEGL